jgi:hypothetical protein
MRRPLLQVFLLCCLVVGSLVAVEPLADAELQAGLKEAIDRGDSARLESLGGPLRAGTGVPPELSPLTCLYVGIAIMDRPSRALAFFERAASDPALQVRARCWMAECYIFLRYPLIAREMAEVIRQSDPRSPAIAYIEGRIAWINLREAPPKWEARRQPLRERLTYLAAACTNEGAQKHPDFERRFFTLGIDAGYVEANLTTALEYALKLREYTPRNQTLARKILTLDWRMWRSEAPAQLAMIAQEAELPPDEVARWQQRYQAFTGDYVAWDLQLADESRGTTAGAPDLFNDRMVLHFRLARALGHTWKDRLESQKKGPSDGAPPPHGHPRFVEIAQTFAQLSVNGPYPRFASWALEMLDMARVIDPALVVGDDLELKLRVASNDFHAGVPFFVRELPAHLTDNAWLLRYLPVARLAPPDVFRRYVDALAQVNPSLRMLPLLQAEARVDEPDALARYRAIFEGPPGAVAPTESDWDHYASLLEDGAERAGFLDGASAGPGAVATFDATVERWHQRARAHPTVAEQHAYLLMRRARIANSPESYNEALAAAERAFAAGSQSVTLMRRQREIAALAETRATHERQMAAQDRAIETGLAKDRAAVRRKIEERQRARGGYIASINERVRDLELELNYGDRDPDERRSLRGQISVYHGIIKNFCSSCDALGLQLENGEDCIPCGGTGKLHEDGPGLSASGR